MVSQEAAHYVLSSLSFTQGHVKVVAWKERVDNFNSKATKLLQTAYGMSCFSKVFPSAIGRSLHYKRAVSCEVHNLFFLG